MLTIQETSIYISKKAKAKCSINK